MKPAGPTLIALLASRQFYVADLYNFLLVGGGTLNYLQRRKEHCLGRNHMECGWNGRALFRPQEQ